MSDQLEVGDKVKVTIRDHRKKAIAKIPGTVEYVSEYGVDVERYDGGILSKMPHDDVERFDW